jgi:hypothetical protein
MATKKTKLTALQQAFKKELNRIMRGVKRAEKQGYIFDENKLPKTPKRVTSKSVEKLQKIKPSDLKAKAKKVDYETGELISGKKAIKQEKQIAKEKAKETRRLNKLNKELEQNRRKAPAWEDDYYEDVYVPSQKEQKPAEPVTTDSGYKVDPTSGEILERPEPKTDREKFNKKHGLDKYKEDKQQEPRIEYPTFSNMVISNFKADVSHFPAMAEPMLLSWLDQLISQYGADDVAEMLEEAKGAGVWIDYTVAYRKDLLLGMISDMMEYLPDASDWFKKDLADKFEYDEDWETPD